MLKGFIYCVTCLPTGKWYFGQTSKTVEERFNKHIKSAARNSKFKLHAAIRKYGEENFLVEEVMFVEAPTKDALKRKLDYIEIRLIRKFDTFRNGYNMTLGGEGFLGQNHSPETLLKISEKLKGRIHSEKTRKKLSKPNKGKKRSIQTCQKISQGKIGRKHTQETRVKISKSLSGKSRPKEVCEKISISHLGEKHWMFGKKHSEESIRKMSAAKRGKKLSEETRLKMSLSHLKRNSSHVVRL